MKEEIKINLNIARENLKKTNKDWEKKVIFFHSECKKKIEPIFFNLINPRYIKQKGIITTKNIYDFFLEDSHYHAAMLNIMCFIRKENTWEFGYKFIKTIVQNNNFYDEHFSHKILESKIFENINSSIPIIFNNDIKEKYTNEKMLKNYIKEETLNNKNIFIRKNIDNINSKIKKIKKVISEKTLNKDFLEIFLYAEYYHNDSIYTLFLHDIDKSLIKLGYNPEWRNFYSKYIVAFLVMLIYETYVLSSNLYEKIKDNNIKELNLIKNYEHFFPIIKIKKVSDLC